MAVIDLFECTVSVNGSTAKEYDEDPDDTRERYAEGFKEKVITKYIEAKSGANFRIHFRVMPDYSFQCNHLSWHILLDGEFSSGGIIYKSEYLTRNRHDHFREGVYSVSGSGWEFRKFKFGDLEIDDGPQQNLCNLSEKTIKELGTVTVEVWRRDEAQKTVGQTMNPMKIREGPVPEKALKGRAVTLSATLDKPIASQPQSTVSGRRLDKHAVATFQFKYRSKKSLRDELIVPRTPPPEERPVEELTSEEMRELLGEQRENAVKQEQAQRKIKRERPESMQMPSKPYKVARNEDGIEVINLADDDNEDSNTRSQNAVPSNRVATAPTANRHGIVDLEDFEPED